MRTVLLFIFSFVALTGWGQRICIVASMEDHIPLRDAIIHTNTNHWARTDYRGYWAMKYSFDSAVVSKPGYIKTTVYLNSLPDTIFLLPQARQLHEVTIWGQDQQHLKAMEESARQTAAENGAPRGILNGDFLGWMDRRSARDRKHRKEAQKILQNYDNADKKTTGDPIMDAYLKQKQEEEEQRLSGN